MFDYLTQWNDWSSIGFDQTELSIRYAGRTDRTFRKEKH